MTETNQAGAGDMASRWFDQMVQMNQRLLNETLRKTTQSNETGTSMWFDMLDSWRRIGNSATQHPGKLVDQQMELWSNQLQLLQNTFLRMAGRETPALIAPEKGDRRFTDSEWTENPLFDYLKQAYLLTSRGLLNTVRTAEGIDEKERQRLLFSTRQWINGMAPTNFPLSNPEVLRLSRETGQQNLVRGLERLLEDMEQSADVLKVCMTDENAFHIGDNIATTPGKVIFRNRMFELLQYQPVTETVHRTPLLIVPPWVNKYYILDLHEGNSFVRWAVAQGHTVFMLSWVNPSRDLRDVRIDDYMEEGVLAALTAIEQACGERSANVVGYCAGGILLGIVLAWLAARGQADRIASGTYLTTMFDYTDPGDLGLFIDESMVKSVESQLEERGVFDGRLLAVAFSMLRENDLYWNYYVQNYLKGERPLPYDLLYWNSDCTNMPGPTHRFFLRELYLGNKLKQPGAISVSGEPVDIGRIKTPVFMLATLQDHIAKWRGCYAGVALHGGPVTFVLGESGHVAGTINPPGGKYGYYRNDQPCSTADDWFKGATRHDGSWWLTWQEWIKPYQGDEVPARLPGDGKLKVLCDAPGEYVMVKAQDALEAVA